MILIWEKFIDKTYSGEMLIKEAFAKENNVKISWVNDKENMSIQALVNKICDQLEAEGYDLEITSTEAVKNRFLEYEIFVEAPIEYSNMAEAKDQAEKVLKKLQEYGADASAIEQTHRMINLLVSKMKELS
tara:strand:- start:24 stop:416 length:393 start_codon:yes stop_codon:yes gene_type:complete